MIQVGPGVLSLLLVAVLLSLLAPRAAHGNASLSAGALGYQVNPQESQEECSPEVESRTASRLEATGRCGCGTLASDCLLAARGVGALSKAGQVADRAGLTKAGRALAKHGGRRGSVFPKATGNPAALNKQGQAVLDDILGNVSKRSPNKFGGTDFFGGSRGGGARFDGRGNFRGFLEP